MRKSIFKLLLHLILLCIILIYRSPVMAFDRGFAPEVGINYTLNKNYSLNSKVESVLYFPGGDYSGYAYDGTDIQLFLGRRINPFKSFALGYQISLSDLNTISHRTIQQYTLVFREANFRIGHRFRADQTFGGSNPIQLRLRYRFSAEFPLQGESIDPGEFYLVGSEEIIVANRDQVNSLENRLAGYLGILTGESGQRVQAGVDFRSRYRNGELSNSLWLKVTFLIWIG